MSQQRRNPNETPEERSDRLFKESVSNHATRSEKTAWARKQTNLEKYVTTKINPKEEEIRDLQAGLIGEYDVVNDMRKEMVESCIHPFDMLVVDGEYAVCRFCNKRMAKPVITDE